MEDIDETVTNTFVVCWCNEGLESVVPVSDMEKEDTWRVLQGQEPHHQAGRVINMLKLRARFNPQRYYEIWVVDAMGGITAEDLTSMFAQDPQYAADLIRDKGTKLYGERMPTKSILIR